MTNEDNSSVINDSESVKLLYEVLLEEYVGLRIFSEAEARDLLEGAKKHKLVSHDVDERRHEFSDLMLAMIRRKLHEKLGTSNRSLKNGKQQPPFAALCLSGGGIRSATFCLGILQGLARHGLLEKFHYLSTVSGGGYIGSWLSAWIFRKRHEIHYLERTEFDKSADFSSEYVKKVQKELALCRDTEIEDSPTGFKAEPPQITHLRTYNNYMSPRPGLFTVEGWTLITVYLRNLLMNWMVLIPLIAAMLLLPRLFYGIIAKTRDYLPAGEYVSGEEVLLFGLSLIAGSVAVGFIIAFRPTFRRYFWSGREQITKVKSAEAKVISLGVILALFSVFGFTVFWAWLQKNHFQGVPSVYSFIIYGVALYLFGVVFVLIFAVFRTSRKRTSSRESSIRFYPMSEILSAVISGGIYGALLYVVVSIFTMYEQLRYFQLLFACFGVPLFLIVFLLSAAIFMGVSSKITNDMDTEWLSRFGALLLICAVGWSIISVIVLLGFSWLPALTTFSITSVVSISGGISGLIIFLFGFAGKAGARDEKTQKSKLDFLLRFPLHVAAPIFALFLMIVIAQGTYHLMLYVGREVWELQLPIVFLLSETKNETTGEVIREIMLLPNFFVSLFWISVLTAIGILMGFVVNINKFSLHATYRQRLIRSYLGASRGAERMKTSDSFTDLDEMDNVGMRELLQRPFHVVNIAMNPTKSSHRGKNEKVESFTVTALHCGSSNMDDGNGNFRKTENYARSTQTGNPISLGTAAAISGTAASPILANLNMRHYASSPVLSFLMALFNVRLGWWLGNPGRPGDKTFSLAAPRWSPKVFFADALGLTNDRSKYVYLSDGGHFDNLGLYEMVLRRVNLIVACDASADADFRFEDFANTIHKIRVDLGIPIEFSGHKGVPIPGRNCAIATIMYSAVDGNDPRDDGILIYIKPTLDGSESIDLINYKKSNPDFPHEPTADQRYSETQFECYRKLGLHMINSFCCLTKNSPCEKCFELSDLIDNAKRYLHKHREADEMTDTKKEAEKKIWRYLKELEFPNKKAGEKY